MPMLDILKATLQRKAHGYVALSYQPTVSNLYLLLLMQAFQELQVKMVSTTQQLKIADFQIEQLKRQIVHAKLVEKEMDSLPKDIRTYEGVGRM